MTVPSAYQTSAPRLAATEQLRRPRCPRCGSVVLVAEASRFDVKGRIVHIWSCDDCGNTFTTAIRLWRR